MKPIIVLFTLLVILVVSIFIGIVYKQVDGMRSNKNTVKRSLYGSGNFISKQRILTPAR